MNDQYPEDILVKFLAEYEAIQSPKYLYMSYTDWKERYETLVQFKDQLEGEKGYRDLVNALSQILPRIAKLSSSGTWNNFSERGINKSLPVLVKKGNLNVAFPYRWKDKSGYECQITNGYWGARNYMVMDVLGYIFLLKEGGDTLPKVSSELFKTKEEIIARGKCFEDEPGPSSQAREIRVASENELEAIIACENSLRFEDKDFRQFVGLKLPSNEILEIIHQTSRVEFKLRYPVRLKDREGRMQEHYYLMNFFSRLFEFGYIEKMVTQDSASVRRRVYFVAFNTMLGELFIHNLKAKNYNPIPNIFYSLPESAQLFYRKFIVNNGYSSIPVNLSTIARDLNLKDKNVTNLRSTVVNTIFTPLERFGIISGYEVEEGLDGTKFVISRQVLEGM